MCAVKSLIWLPDDCWLDVLSELSRPFVASRFSLVSQRFAALSNRRIWTKRRKLAPLFVCCDRIGLLAITDEQQHFVERPMPICAPPKNLQISSITVFICNCLDTVFNMLCQLSAVRPCAIQLDGTVADPCHLRLFERPEFGTILARAKRIRLGHHPVWGLPLTALSSCADSKLENARQSMLNIPTLECHLISEADFHHLLLWLHHCPTANDHFGAKSIKKCLSLFCDHFPNFKLANSFIRMVIQIFSRSTDPCQFAIKFIMRNYDKPSPAVVNNCFNALPFASTHFNCYTGESLNLSAVGCDQQQIVLLERQISEKMQIDANICEEMMDENHLIEGKREENVLIIFK
ncbi:hypothetical protein niasHT_034304 [Heterodera trifolii]|uniref:F-box domain-containing protein n=1 Tax=Heterodera trifolii TaxID=157864 RepID=A0ABD2HNX3_9BILA